MNGKLMALLGAFMMTSDSTVSAASLTAMDTHHTSMGYFDYYDDDNKRPAAMAYSSSSKRPSMVAYASSLVSKQ